MKSCVLILVLLILFSDKSSAQYCERDTIFKKITEPKEIKLTIEGYPFIRTLRVSKEVLKKNFRLVLEDSSFQFLGGHLNYLYEGGRLCLPVFESGIDTNELDFLQQLKENEFLSFEELVVQKDGKKFKIPSLFIAITE